MWCVVPLSKGANKVAQNTEAILPRPHYGSRELAVCLSANWFTIQACCGSISCESEEKKMKITRLKILVWWCRIILWYRRCYCRVL